MTRPKTSIEKLTARNEKVKDLKSALDASRWKWREVQIQARMLGDLIMLNCGFCMLAMEKRTVDKTRKCSHCPPEIIEECDRIQKENMKIGIPLGELIVSVREFLDEVKY